MAADRLFNPFTVVTTAGGKHSYRSFLSSFPSILRHDGPYVARFAFYRHYATRHASHRSHGRFASPRHFMPRAGERLVSFIVYNPSFAFHATYYVHTSARRASYRSHARFTSTRRIAPRTDERHVYFVIYTPSFAFQHSYSFALIVASSPETLAALFRVRRDGQAPAQPSFLPTDLRAPFQTSASTNACGRWADRPGKVGDGEFRRGAVLGSRFPANTSHERQFQPAVLWTFSYEPCEYLLQYIEVTLPTSLCTMSHATMGK
ncbi:hypothetical protein B0H13DRAFT_1862837 [Mycena leptocephala]|nr:hypothetical protein B0H13DRAFT_1862837 [Mycena leptocephala]